MSAVAEKRGVFKKPSRPTVAEWKSIVVRYERPVAGRAIWQILNRVVPYVALWYGMHLSLAVSWWLTVPLAVLAGAFLVRIFILFHDCGHRSLFRSGVVNAGVAFDAERFYLADRCADAIHVWDGFPAPDSEPSFTLPMLGPGRLSCDREWLCAAPFEGQTVLLWRVADLAPGRSRRAEGARRRTVH